MSAIKREPNRSKIEDKRNSKKGEDKPRVQMKKHKNNAVQILQWSNATPIRRYGGRGYECCFCDEQFPEPADLKKHSIQSHDMVKEIFKILGKFIHSLCIKLDITALQCKICDEKIDNVELLMKHLHVVHGKEMYLDIRHQILPFKFDSEMLRCFICQNVFNKFKTLLEHMSIHYKNFTCDECGAGFVNRNKLYGHSASHKTGVFACDHCPKVFTTQISKKTHEYQVHIHARMLNRCRYCDAMFRDVRQKDKHIAEVHGITTFARKCQACEKTFIHHNALLKHVKRHHLIERPYKCMLCEKDFFSSAELKGHMVNHTGERDFQCKICFKSYGRKVTLREHMRIHADDRRFRCVHCNMAFVQKCSWRSHMKAKHGETDL